MYQSYLSAFQIGLVAGMRAMTAPAVVSHKLSTTTTELPADSPLHFMTSPNTATVFKVLAGGELIGDKIPGSPDRTSPPQLVGRLVSGAMSGAALSEAEGQSATWGTVLGGLGALAGTFAFFHLRHFLTHEKGLPDPVVALAEDALTIALGLATVDTALDPAF
ncbi:DUF4126 family protein [Spirosoma rigui]|uniref:DUF4126 family protein n=1 Tax=Spirosoma rigui TaxID=564064 RepID=UPI0009AFE110|nr:DUF4126 family protein [Spirosoma rigui]